MRPNPVGVLDLGSSRGRLGVYPGPICGRKPGPIRGRSGAMSGSTTHPALQLHAKAPVEWPTCRAHTPPCSRRVAKEPPEGREEDLPVSTLLGQARRWGKIMGRDAALVCVCVCQASVWCRGQRATPIFAGSVDRTLSGPRLSRSKHWPRHRGLTCDCYSLSPLSTFDQQDFPSARRGSKARPRA